MLLLPLTKVRFDMNTIWYTYLGDLEAEELDPKTTDVRSIEHDL